MTNNRSRHTCRQPISRPFSQPIARAVMTCCVLWVCCGLSCQQRTRHDEHVAQQPDTPSAVGESLAPTTVAASSEVVPDASPDTSPDASPDVRIEQHREERGPQPVAPHRAIATTDTSNTSPQSAPNYIACTPLVRVDRQARVVAFDATSVLDTGFLEQFVCLKETREHESLFVFEGKASDVHAALLLAGAIPGSPGRWREVETSDGTFAVEGVLPEGTEIEITVQLPSGALHPIAWFAREAPVAGLGNRTPPARFVFGGSRFVKERDRGGQPSGRERYLADSSGSLVGLVTFGDETIGAREVIPDQASVAAPIWEAHTERMPKPGTKVTVFLRVVTPS